MSNQSQSNLSKAISVLQSITSIPLTEPLSDFRDDLIYQNNAHNHISSTDKLINSFESITKKINFQSPFTQLIEDLQDLSDEEIVPENSDSESQSLLEDRRKQKHQLKKGEFDFQNMLKLIGEKMQESSRQFNQNLQNILEDQRKQKYQLKEGEFDFQNMLKLIGEKMQESLRQFNQNLQNNQLDQGFEQQFASNEFIDAQYEIQSKLEGVREYCEQLKENTIGKYMEQHQKQQEKKILKLDDVATILSRVIIEIWADAFNAIKYDNKQESSSDSPTKKSFPKVSSAQSQRIKSTGSKRGSQGSQDFNLQLTTKNDRNMFSHKQDSLLYSAASNFQGSHANPIEIKNKTIQVEKVYEEENEKESIQKEEEISMQKREEKSIQKEEEKSIQKEEEKSIQKEEEKSIQKIKENSLGKDEKEAEKESISKYEKEEEISIIDEHIEQINETIEREKSEGDENKQIYQSANFQKKNISQPKKRVETESGMKKDLSKGNVKFNKVNFLQIEGQSHSNSNVFSTEIQTYQNKISKLKQVKQIKKKKLQNELAKVNFEIHELKKKEEEIMVSQKSGEYASRVKIANNAEAKKKAQNLVKNLRSQKRNRNMAKIGDIKNLDKNINDYMEELMKLRAENEEKGKQKKKLEILERMKKNEMRKLNEQKKIEQTHKFVNKIKKQPIQSSIPKVQAIRKSPIKIPEAYQNVTPDLTDKKANLYKIRSLSVKKSDKDVYEPYLG